MAKVGQDLMATCMMGDQQGPSSSMKEGVTRMAEEDIPDFFGLTCASYEWEQFYQSMVVEELPYDMPVAC